VFARPDAVAVPDPGPVSAPVSRDDVDREAPAPVVAAVAIGTAPLPIIGVYAVMFLIHGSVRPVQPPDVTGTKTGEFLVGWLALAVFIALTVALLSFLNGRRRWPFAVMQLGILGLCIDFAADNTISGQRVSILVAVLSAVALVLAFTPAAWQYVDRRMPGRLATMWQRVLHRRDATVPGDGSADGAGGAGTPDVVAPG